MNSVVDKFNPDAITVSKESLNKLLESKVPFALIIPKFGKTPNPYFMIREAFQKMSYGIYPVAVTDKVSPGRIYLVTKKPSVTTENFKNSLSDVYHESKNFSLIYVENSVGKTLHENTSSSFLYEPDISKVELLISSSIGKKLNLLGVEVPLNSDMKSAFHSSGLMIFPMDQTEFNKGKSWKALLNESK